MSTVTKSIRPRRLSHPNLILEDYDASLAHLQDLFGAVLLMDMPKPEWHASLVDIGGLIFELFSPPKFLLNSRHGPHFLGIEYEADMTEVRAAIAAHGVRIIRDLGIACHTAPADCIGVDFEFYQGSFYENLDPTVAPNMIERVRPPSYWRDEHPLGMQGLKAYTLAVSDIEAAKRFVQSFLSGVLVYDEARPESAARAIGLQVADAVLELISPTGNGPARRELERVGQGISSMVFRVRDLDQAKRYFLERNVELVGGTAPDRFLVAPEANRGVFFEFSE
jgi:catechol 2,3-dioxygenase-like lactoylglutathione lyase family enzyme